jgi:hypothetical protein
VKFHLNLQKFMGPGEDFCFFSSVGRVIQATAWFFPGAAPEAMALQRLKRTAMMPSLFQKVAPQILDSQNSFSDLASAGIISHTRPKTYENCLPIHRMLESEPHARFRLSEAGQRTDPTVIP